MNAHALPNPRLATLDSEDLKRRMTGLLNAERLGITEFLWHLAEFDRRSLHLEAGYSSLFVYCTQALRLSDGSAFRRTTAARLLSKYPVIAEYLSDGRISLAALALLKDVLTPENHREVLVSASGKTEQQVRVLLANLCPRSDVEDSVRL